MKIRKEIHNTTLQRSLPGDKTYGSPLLHFTNTNSSTNSGVFSEDLNTKISKPYNKLDSLLCRYFENLCVQSGIPDRS